MLHLTKDDHFKFGYNNKHLAPRMSADDKWFVRFGRCSRKPENFYREMELALLDIRNKTDKTLYFLLSGGIDSEMMCNAVLSSKIDNVKFLFVNYAEHNSHDLYFAQKWATSNNVELEYYNFDVKQFWASDDAKKLAYNIRCVSPEMLAYSKILEYVNVELNGVPISGAGDSMVYHKTKGLYEVWKREKILCPSRFLYQYNLMGVPSFFQYSPELMFSWFLDFAEFNKTIPLNVGEDTYAKIRFLIYQKYVPTIEPRRKYTGFEFMFEERTALRNWMFNRLWKDLGNCNETAVFALSDVYAQLKPLSYSSHPYDYDLKFDFFVNNTTRLDFLLIDEHLFKSAPFNVISNLIKIDEDINVALDTIITNQIQSNAIIYSNGEILDEYLVSRIKLIHPNVSIITITDPDSVNLSVYQFEHSNLDALHFGVISSTDKNETAAIVVADAFWKLKNNPDTQIVFLTPNVYVSKNENKITIKFSMNMLPYFALKTLNPPQVISSLVLKLLPNMIDSIDAFDTTLEDFCYYLLTDQKIHQQKKNQLSCDMSNFEIPLRENSLICNNNIIV